MATRVIRRMSLAKASIVVFVAVALLTSLLMIKLTQGGEALPLGPTDQAAVPHYFGPWPNWVLSPLTLPDATVAISDPGGIGTGATATATVGGNGAVTGITITNPGSGYTAANVSISGAGTGATATADGHQQRGGRRGQRRPPAAPGTASPTVTLSGGGATTDATATAYGSVDAYPAAERRQRLHPPDRGPRRAGRPERDAGHGARHVRRGHRARSPQSSSTTPARAISPRRRS